MIIELSDTDAGAVASSVLSARRSTGVASGLVMTLIVVVTSNQYSAAFDAAQATAAEHPSRIIMVVKSRAKKTAMDAEIRIGEGVPGDMITLRISGDLIDQADSVVLPLLLPDLPVVAWWPGSGPELPGQAQIGHLATRRITDAGNADDPLGALIARAKGPHSAADTDLTWTRLTRWRALIASALDQYRKPVRSAVVEAAEENAPAELLAAWLDWKLGVPVEVKTSMGPGITGVHLETDDGEVALVRNKTANAQYIVPNQPARTAALARRTAVELLSEELRRLGPDDVFEYSLRKLAERAEQ